MQNSTICFFRVKSFQFVNEQLCWEQRSIHCDDCHSPPHSLRIGLDDDRSQPGRSAAVARSDPWPTPPAQVGFSGDVIRRRRLPWVVGSDLWNNSRGGDYLRRDRRGEDRHPELEICVLARLDAAKVGWVDGPGQEPADDVSSEEFSRVEKVISPHPAIPCASPTPLAARVT